MKQLPLRLASQAARPFMCQRCCFTTTRATQAGHSKWANIKHDKARADVKKRDIRERFSKKIAVWSRCMQPFQCCSVISMPGVHC